MERRFEDLGLPAWIIKQCNEIGVKQPTPIQENCIPPILQGKDCIGAASTGSGKTLAFAIPIIQKLSEDPYGIFALILTPTRELAFQIAEQFVIIGKPINLRYSVIVGGEDMVRQGTELAKKPHIVVATPGRLADHLESCDTFSLKKIKFLVLDEADRLLGGFFDAQLKTIFNVLPKKKQSLFFSATITDTLEKLKTVTGNEVFMWGASNDETTVDQLKQYYVLSPREAVDAYLVQTVNTYRSENQSGNIIIFTDTCKNCQALSITLNEVGFENVALHAMMAQKKRLASLTQFKSNRVKILIATDVASRGLDIPAVQLVINHRLPKLAKEYIHRVGRTARAGRSGMAISVVIPSDIPMLQNIEENIHTKLSEYKISDKEVGKIFTQVIVTKREAEIKLDDSDFYEKKMINKRKRWILEGKDPDEEEAKINKLKKHKKRSKDKIKKNSESNELCENENVTCENENVTCDNENGEKDNKQ